MRYWTQEERDTLISMKEAGYSHQEIGDTLGRTEASVGNQIMKLKIAVASYWTEEDEARLIAMRQAGQSYQEIADTLGRSYDAIRIKSKNLKVQVSTAGRPWTKEEQRQLLDLFDRGYSNPEIAKRLNRNAHVVWAALRRMGRSGRERSHLLTAHSVKQVLNVRHRVVIQWIKWGLLRPDRTRPGKHLARLISYDRLLAFLENPDTWMLWEPFQLVDPVAQKWAQEMRDAHPWRWVYGPDAARMIGFSPSWFYQIAHQRNIPHVHRGIRYWVRSDIVEQVAANPDMRFPGPSHAHGVSTEIGYRRTEQEEAA